jgi:hypothetical protein
VRTLYEVHCGDFTLAFPKPDRLPEPGDVYETTISFTTLAQVDYNIGDRFEVLERTSMTRHGRHSSIGNLLIKCRHRTSVWTEFDAGVASGQFKLVEKING